MTENLRRLGARYERALLASLMLDVAHRDRRDPGVHAHVSLVPGQFPLVVRVDGVSYSDATHGVLTVEQTLGLWMALAGPTNPGDGPCGMDLHGNVYYALRGTDHVFLCRTKSAGPQLEDGRRIDISLERP